MPADDNDWRLRKASDDLFWETFLRRHPTLEAYVRRDDTKPWYRVALVPPHWPGHLLYIGDVAVAAATVCYSDGGPPGPAEAHFDWRSGDHTSAAIESMCDYADDVIQGRVILVRERLSRFVQFVRRHDCDSLLSFVERKEFRRRKQILRAWSWTKAILPEPEVRRGASRSDGN